MGADVCMRSCMDVSPSKQSHPSFDSNLTRAVATFTRHCRFREREEASRERERQTHENCILFISMMCGCQCVLCRARPPPRPGFGLGNRERERRRDKKGKWCSVNYDIHIQPSHTYTHQISVIICMVKFTQNTQKNESIVNHRRLQRSKETNPNPNPIDLNRIDLRRSMPVCITLGALILFGDGGNQGRSPSSVGDETTDVSSFLPRRNRARAPNNPFGQRP